MAPYRTDDGGVELTQEEKYYISGNKALDTHGFESIVKRQK